MSRTRDACGASPPESSQKVIVKGRPEFAMCGGEKGNTVKKEYPVWVIQALRKFEDILWK